MIELWRREYRVTNVTAAGQSAAALEPVS
jgi:hypothetical protein